MSKLWRNVLKGLELALVQVDHSKMMKVVLGVVEEQGRLVGEPKILLMKMKTISSAHSLQNTEICFLLVFCFIVFWINDVGVFKKLLSSHGHT